MLFSSITTMFNACSFLFLPKRKNRVQNVFEMRWLSWNKQTAKVFRTISLFFFWTWQWHRNCMNIISIANMLYSSPPITHSCFLFFAQSFLRAASMVESRLIRWKWRDRVLWACWVDRFTFTMTHGFCVAFKLQNEFHFGYKFVFERHL